MRFGYTILYVPDVAATLAHYTQAYDLAIKFQHESGDYAELDTGATVLAFASESLAELHGIALRPSRKGELAAAFELALVCNDPDAAYARALSFGASPLAAPKDMPWGQRVSYVRDINGCVIELCNEVAG